MDRGAVPSAAASRINKVADDGGRYVAESDGKDSVFLHPDVRRGSELPNRVDHPSVNPEAAQDIELVVVEDREPTGQSYPVTITGPGRINGLDNIGGRVVAEDAIGSGGLPTCRAADTVNVRRSIISKDAASHVTHLIVRIGGGLNRPSMVDCIIFKRMREIVAGSIHAASAHGIKLRH